MLKRIRLAAIVVTCLSFAGSVSAQAKSFDILTHEVKQGGTIVIKIDKDFLDGQTALRIFDKVYWPDANGLVFIGVDLVTIPDTYIVYLWNDVEEERVDWYYDEIKVVDGNFIEKPWPFRPFKPNPNGGNKKRREERVLINNALDYLARDPEERYLEGRFTAPLTRMEIVEDFGVKRVSRGIVVERHGGVDLRTNDPYDRRDRATKPIFAINSGKVLLAKKFSLEGNMVIVYHGQGVYSLYMHMSQFKVKTNQIIQRGHIIGMSGNTGQVTGPHLDFRIKINGSYVNPLEFIETANKYLDNR